MRMPFWGGGELIGAGLIDSRWLVDLWGGGMSIFDGLRMIFFGKWVRMGFGGLRVWLENCGGVVLDVFRVFILPSLVLVSLNLHTICYWWWFDSLPSRVSAFTISHCFSVCNIFFCNWIKKNFFCNFFLINIFYSHCKFILERNLMWIEIATIKYFISSLFYSIYLSTYFSFILIIFIAFIFVSYSF